MSRDTTALKDTFWSGELCFLCEERYRDISKAERKFVERTGLDSLITETGQLPDLGGAPLASWFLARLARLAGRRFPYSYGDVIGSDGADYWLRFYCLGAAAAPVGVVSCTGKREQLSLFAELLGDVPGEVILDAFVAALLKAPSEVSRAKVIVQYTEMTDDEVAFHIPQVYGWDGQAYFNEGAPEHRVDPSEYE